MTDEELIERMRSKERIGELVVNILERCDLLAISDGAKLDDGQAKYAVAFAARDDSVMDYVQGDDLEALLREALDRVSEA